MTVGNFTVPLFPILSKRRWPKGWRTKRRGPPRSLVVRGPELNTRLMETYAETRYSRGRRRSRSSPRSSSLFHSGSARLYLSAFPPLPEPPSPSTLCIPRRVVERAIRQLFRISFRSRLRTRVASTVEEESSRLAFGHSSVRVCIRLAFFFYDVVKADRFFLFSFLFPFLRSTAASWIVDAYRRSFFFIDAPFSRDIH